MTEKLKGRQSRCGGELRVTILANIDFEGCSEEMERTSVGFDAS